MTQNIEGNVVGAVLRDFMSGGGGGLRNRMWLAIKLFVSAFVSGIGWILGH